MLINISQNLEEIIDPADTRALVAKWCSHMYENDLPERIAHRLSGTIAAQFCLR